MSFDIDNQRDEARPRTGRTTRGHGPATVAVEAAVDVSTSSRNIAYMAGQYDLSHSGPGTERGRQR